MDRFDNEGNDNQRIVRAMSTRAMNVAVAADGDNEGNDNEGVREVVEPTEVEVFVDFMDSETLAHLFARDAIVRHLKAKCFAEASRQGKPAGTTVKLSWDGRLLEDRETLAPLHTLHLQGCWAKSENSYRFSREQEIVLVSEGDAEWNEELCNKAQVYEDKWVPAPPTPEEDGNSASAWPEGKTLRNMARLSEVQDVWVSSSLWGNNPVATEKLHNVLRLGSRHGEPRFVGGDNSFIFKENEAGDPTMVIDFGCTVDLLRLGSMCYGDRFINKLRISTSIGEGETEEWTLWGESKESKRNGGVIFFDRALTSVRRVKIIARSGHYGGAGARIGPIFAWGFEG